MEQSILKRKYSHLSGTLAKKQMIADNIPEAHIPGARALDGARHRYLKKQSKFCVDVVEMLKAFLNNPPEPVCVYNNATAKVSSDEVRFVFYESSNLQSAVRYVAECPKVVVIADCTYQTNRQRPHL